MFEGDDFFDGIFHYGHPASELPEGVENISVTDDDVLMKTYGYYSGTEKWDSIYKPDMNDDAHITFNRRTMNIIRDKVKDGDFIFFTNGPAHQLLYDSIKPLEDSVACIEYMVSYYATLVNYFKVYSSYGHRIWCDEKFGTYNSINNKLSERVISWGPNPSDFEFNENKEDYFVFLGRIVEGKGIDLCIQLANILGIELRIAGQGVLTDLEYDVNNFPENIKILGPVNKEERRELLKNAKGLIAPSVFYESLGWQAIEAMLSGTPVITTDFGGFAETNIHGVTGYRCNTFSDFAKAVENIDNIDNEACYTSALSRFNYDVIKKKYLEYFQYINDVLNGSGFYEGV
tara:strand:+ start:719 stop:1753 length:1035 start_codon:yes stop_codon:yes gene_type:complete